MVMISGPAIGLPSQQQQSIPLTLPMPAVASLSPFIANLTPATVSPASSSTTTSPDPTEGLLAQQVEQQLAGMVYAPTAVCSPSPTASTMPSLSPLTFCNPLIITPGSWKQHYGMEQVWVKEFNSLFFSYLPHLWYIQPVEFKPIGGRSLTTFVDSAKVRFCCDVCGHGWTSMKGRVAFWFDLFYIHGIVAFKLYGQQCDRCKADRYEQPMWYPEEVAKVLVNVYNKIGQTYYGFYCPPIEKTRRAGKPRTPHNADLCQACQDGLCADRK